MNFDTGPYRRFAQQFAAIGPHAGAHRVALRVAISLAIPLLTLWSLGRLDLSIYATFGAFASLYGRDDVFSRRIVMQVQAGVVQVVSLAVGTTLSAAAAPPLVSVAAVALIAGLVTVISRALRWHPPGALFAVFAAGATASIPASADAVWHAAVLGTAAVAVALIVTVLFAAVRGALAETADAVPAAMPSARTWGAAGLVTLGAAVAGAAAIWVTGDHWYWAMVAAVAAMSRPHLQAQMVRGAQRLVGTLLGVLIAAGLFALDMPPLAVILVALACQAGAELFVGRNYAIALLFITPLALLMVELAAPTNDPGQLLADRALDTAVGVAAALVVGVLVWLAERGRTASSAR